MWLHGKISLAVLGIMFALASPAMAQDATGNAQAEAAGEDARLAPITAPYDPQLLRLSEVLGSLHYLRPLCGADEKNTWRDHMQALIEVEQPRPKRREELIARFNRGYRAFDQTYTSCTDSALLAAANYRKEGIQLSTQITGRYGR